jgi:hypothetical protein
MTSRRLQLLSSTVLVLGTVGLVSPTTADAAPSLICGPVCSQICLDGMTDCAPCVWDGTCLDNECSPPGEYVQVNCTPP